MTMMLSFTSRAMNWSPQRRKKNRIVWWKTHTITHSQDYVFFSNVLFAGFRTLSFSVLKNKIPCWTDNFVFSFCDLLNRARTIRVTLYIFGFVYSKCTIRRIFWWVQFVLHITLKNESNCFDFLFVNYIYTSIRSFESFRLHSLQRYVSVRFFKTTTTNKLFFFSFGQSQSHSVIDVYSMIVFFDKSVKILEFEMRWRLDCVWQEFNTISTEMREREREEKNEMNQSIFMYKNKSITNSGEWTALGKCRICEYKLYYMYITFFYDRFHLIALDSLYSLNSDMCQRRNSRKYLFWMWTFDIRLIHAYI